MSDLSFLKSFLTEDLYILKEEKNKASEEASVSEQHNEKEYQIKEHTKENNLKEPTQEIISKPFPPSKGSFNKKIFITVQESESEFIKDSDLDFLLKILSAVKLTLDDVAIVNTTKKEINIEDLHNWSVTHYMSFTGVANSIQNTSLYSPLLAEKIHFLTCDKLDDIAKDKTKKQQLWTALQRLFLK